MPKPTHQPIDRHKQIELMEAVEDRTRGYVRDWMKNPEVRDAVLKAPLPNGAGNTPKKRKVG
jgi:hypothetical protein